MPARQDSLEERKAREEAFFKECEETGNYTIYEEYEFEKPLPGLTEEIVVEEKVVEESTKIHHNFDPRRKMKIKIQ